MASLHEKLGSDRGEGTAGAIVIAMFVGLAIAGVPLYFIDKSTQNSVKDTAEGYIASVACPEGYESVMDVQSKPVQVAVGSCALNGRTAAGEVTIVRGNPSDNSYWVNTNFLLAVAEGKTPQLVENSDGTPVSAILNVTGALELNQSQQPVTAS